MKSRNLFLFTVCSGIWGTTWFVIKFQIDSTSPTVGAFYRFVLASALMFLFNYFFTKIKVELSRKNHFYFFLHGIFNFSINYILTYMAEEKISSGLVALTFTSLVYFNMIGMRLFFKKPISKNVFLGGALGAFGIILLFWKEVVNVTMGTNSLVGLSIGIIATLSASIGNMFAYKNHSFKIPVSIFNAYGMLYGAGFSFIVGLVSGEDFTFPTTPLFLSSLIYLAIFGTMIGFWAYQTLLGSIGADRAAYTAIISPMIAVVLSSFFENVALTPYFLAGILFCLLGNLVSLKKPSAKPLLT